MIRTIQHWYVKLSFITKEDNSSVERGGAGLQRWRQHQASLIPDKSPAVCFFFFCIPLRLDDLYYLFASYALGITHTFFVVLGDQLTSWQRKLGPLIRPHCNRAASALQKNTDLNFKTSISQKPSEESANQWCHVHVELSMPGMFQGELFSPPRMKVGFNWQTFWASLHHLTLSPPWDL